MDPDSGGRQRAANSGAVVFCMVTRTAKLPLVLLPCVSEAAQCTLVVPTGNVEPVEGVQSTGRGPSTRSVALALKLTTSPVGSRRCHSQARGQRQHGWRRVLDRDSK